MKIPDIRSLFRPKGSAKSVPIKRPKGKAKSVPKPKRKAKSEPIKKEPGLLEAYLLRLNEEKHGRAEDEEDRQIAVVPLSNTPKRLYIFKTQKPGRGSLLTISYMFKDMILGIGYIIFSFIVELIEFLFGWMPGFTVHSVEMCLPFLPILWVSFLAYCPECVRDQWPGILPEWFVPDTQLIALGFGLYYILLTGYIYGQKNV